MPDIRTETRTAMASGVVQVGILYGPILLHMPAQLAIPKIKRPESTQRTTRPVVEMEKSSPNMRIRLKGLDRLGSKK